MTKPVIEHVLSRLHDIGITDVENPANVRASPSSWP
jgi:hypothetical protein